MRFWCVDRLGWLELGFHKKTYQLGLLVLVAEGRDLPAAHCHQRRVSLNGCVGWVGFWWIALLTYIITTKKSIGHV